MGDPGFMKKTPGSSTEAENAPNKLLANHGYNSVACTGNGPVSLNLHKPYALSYSIPPPPLLHQTATDCGASKSAQNNAVFTLPSNLAFPVGIAQIVVGGCMVCCGSYALRYQSYLFYYGAGLWTGMFAGIAGILAVMATKSKTAKPNWACWGRKWQIRIFLSVITVALATATLTAVFSTSGLVRKTHYDYTKTVVEMTPVEKINERRKSLGIAITAILLLLALLQILLCFCSLGITLRVLCTGSKKINRMLIRGSSDGSDNTKKEISGLDFAAKTDRLLRWLGHQKRQDLPRHFKTNFQDTKKQGVTSQLEPRFPRLIPVRAQRFPIDNQYNSLPIFTKARDKMEPWSFQASYCQPVSTIFPLRLPLMMPTPLLIRGPRSLGPPSIADSSKRRYRLVGYNINSARDQSKLNVSTIANDDAQPEITEEEVGKTYTGLDREIAEKFICNAMTGR